MFHSRCSVRRRGKKPLLPTESELHKKSFCAIRLLRCCTWQRRCFRPCTRLGALYRAPIRTHCRGESAPRVPLCFRPCATSAALNRDAESAHCRGESAPRVPLCFRPCATSAALNRDAEPAHCRGESAPRVPLCFRPAAASAALNRAAAATACKGAEPFSSPNERVRRDLIHHKGNPREYQGAKKIWCG